MCYERQFSDLAEALQEVQAHLQGEIKALGPEEAADALCRLQLAAHEWLANLMRHAQFEERTPEVQVRIWKQEARLRCVIDDNSQGFDFETQLQKQRQAMKAAQRFPEGGMGLLLLKAGTEQAEYAPLNGHANRLRLAVELGGCPSNASAGDNDRTFPLNVPPSSDN